MAGNSPQPLNQRLGAGKSERWRRYQIGILLSPLWQAETGWLIETVERCDCACRSGTTRPALIGGAFAFGYDGLQLLMLPIRPHPSSSGHNSRCWSKLRPPVQTGRTRSSMRAIASTRGWWDGGATLWVGAHVDRAPSASRQSGPNCHPAHRIICSINPASSFLTLFTRVEPWRRVACHGR